MKRIPLSHSKFAIVDDDDYDQLKDLKWNAINCGTNLWYAVCNIKQDKWETVLMHRKITNVPIEAQVDHINGDSLDNRKENLRICTPQQNSMNRTKTHGTSQYKGVYWYKPYKNGEQKYIKTVRI